MARVESLLHAPAAAAATGYAGTRMNDFLDHLATHSGASFFCLGLDCCTHRMRQVVQESRALPRSYFTGLNFLLNEQPDRAIRFLP